jgi:hypothetical protein
LPEAQRYKQESLIVNFKVFEPYLRSANFSEPIEYGIRNIFQVKPAKNSLRFKDRVYLKETTLSTDTGSFVESMKTENIVTMDGTDRTTAQMTLSNLIENVNDTGELMTVDYLWQCQIIGSNTVYVIQRSYFT